MSILPFQFFDSYTRALFNHGENTPTGPPGCPQLGFDCNVGTFPNCPDRDPSIVPPNQMRHLPGVWDGGLLGGIEAFHEIMLTNVLPRKTQDQFVCQLEEIAIGNGYIGNQHPLSNPPPLDYQSMPINENFTNAAPSIGIMEGISFKLTASGGNIADWRWIILYLSSQHNPTHRNDSPLVGFWDQGNVVTLTDGQTHEFRFNGADVEDVGNILKMTATPDT